MVKTIATTHHLLKNKTKQTHFTNKVNLQKNAVTINKSKHILNLNMFSLLTH